MAVVYVVIWGCMLLFGATAVWALVWSIRTGQLREFREGAVSIFDEDERSNEATDHFPARRLR